MSDFTAIRAASLTLKALLEAHITNSGDPQLNGLAIDLRSPKEMADDKGTEGISLWLYRVQRNGFAQNNAPGRPAPNQRARHPIPLDLFYLITPVLSDAGLRQAVAGRVLQVLNDHSILGEQDFKDSLENTSGELRVTLDMLPLEELTRIWSALQDDYQLCIPYCVQLVTIDSHHEPTQVTPVLLKQATYAQIVGVTQAP